MSSLHRSLQRPKPTLKRAAASYAFLWFAALLIYLMLSRLVYVGLDNPVVLGVALFLPVVLSLIGVLALLGWLMNVRMKKRLAALETPENRRLLAELEADLRRKYEERLAPIEQRLANPAPLSAAEEQRIEAELKGIAKPPSPGKR